MVYRVMLVVQSKSKHPHLGSAQPLDDSLEFSSVAQCVLYHHPAHLLLLGAVLGGGLGSIGEEDLAVLQNPAALLGKGNNVALGVEEEEGLRGADGQAGVGALAARGDFGADLKRQNL